MQAIAKRGTVDVMAGLLADKRSENTRKAYKRDLEDFFTATTGTEATREGINAFLGLQATEAAAVTLNYKAILMERGLAEATINRRLAAVRSLVSYAKQVGAVQWEITVKGEKVQQYRDTRGVAPADVRAILSRCNISTPKGKRDYALLRLLWDNALRRGEVAKLNVADFDAQARRLAILGKGKGTQREWIDVSERTAKAITVWLQAREDAAGADPLFVAVDHASAGHRLTATAIYNLVRGYAAEAGIDRTLSPHRIRHSAITAALEATNGNVVAVQRLSRHAKVETLMIYEDNRRAYQAEVTNMLAELA